MDGDHLLHFFFDLGMNPPKNQTQSLEWFYFRQEASHSKTHRLCGGQ